MQRGIGIWLKVFSQLSLSKKSLCTSVYRSGSTLTTAILSTFWNLDIFLNEWPVSGTFSTKACTNHTVSSSFPCHITLNASSTQCTWKSSPNLCCGLKPATTTHTLATAPLACRQGTHLKIGRNRDNVYKMLKQKYFVYIIIIRNTHGASLSSPLTGSMCLVSCSFMLTIQKVFFCP